MLDTGVDAANPDLTPNVEAFYNAVEDPVSGSSVSVSNAVDNDGHGTHVSGIAASSNPAIGVAYDAKLVDIKVIADSGESQLGGDPVLRGLEWVAANYQTYNIKVVNMSLGESGVNDNTVTTADAQDAEAVEIKAASEGWHHRCQRVGQQLPVIIPAGRIIPGDRLDDRRGQHLGRRGPGVGLWRTVRRKRRSVLRHRQFRHPRHARLHQPAQQRGKHARRSRRRHLQRLERHARFQQRQRPAAQHHQRHQHGRAVRVRVVAAMQTPAKYFGGHYLSDPNQILQILQQTADDRRLQQPQQRPLQFQYRRHQQPSGNGPEFQTR